MSVTGRCFRIRTGWQIVAEEAVLRAARFSSNRLGAEDIPGRRVVGRPTGSPRAPGRVLGAVGRLPARVAEP